MYLGYTAAQQLYCATRRSNFTSKEHQTTTRELGYVFVACVHSSRANERCKRVEPLSAVRPSDRDLLRECLGPCKRRGVRGCS